MSRGAAPPPPSPLSVAEASWNVCGGTGAPWCLTGEQEFRRGLFGGVVLFVQERRLRFRPVVTGYTPANWRMQTRWRRARMDDLGRRQ